MATYLAEAEYWSKRAERERLLARQCEGRDAAGHLALATRYSDLAHRALRQPIGTATSH